MTTNHEIEPGRPSRLSDISTRAKDYYDGNKETAEVEFKALRDEFIELQPRLYAEGEQKLLIILQANDAGGKDGAIRNVTRGVNP